MTLPISWIRQQFPALRRADTVYLDNAAGAQVPQQVLDRVQQAMTTMQVNKGGSYAASRRVTEAKEAVRAQLATFLNAPEADDVIFGPNATTLIELLAQAVGRALEPGDEIIVSGLDHHANVDPWRRLRERGLVLETWEPEGPRQTLSLAGLEPLLSKKTRWLAMTAASNALGTLTPVAAVAERLRGSGVRLMVDAVHYAPHLLPDVQALGVDALALSPYKVFGPHLGALYLSRELREVLAGPGLSFFPAAAPINWEPGTQNHEAIVGFGGVFDYFEVLADEMGLLGTTRQRWQQLYDAFWQHEQGLLARLLTGLEPLGASRYGLPDGEGRTATLAMNLRNLPPGRVAEALGEAGVAVASGHYYAYALMMERLGLAGRGGALRVSLLHYNDQADVDALLAGLGRL